MASILLIDDDEILCSLMADVLRFSGASKYSTGRYLPAAQLLGAQRTLAKPIRSDALLRAVAEVLARPAPPPEPHPDSAAASETVVPSGP